MRAHMAGVAFGEALCAEASKGLNSMQAAESVSKWSDEKKSKFDYPKRWESIAKNGINEGLSTCGLRVDLSNV